MNNLYCFNATGKIIWQKKNFSRGRWSHLRPTVVKLITCSWRYYKEDFSQVVLYDEAERDRGSPAGN